MAVSTPEAQALCDRLVAHIRRLGPRAFGFHEFAILYSGPGDNIEDARGRTLANNPVRSTVQAEDLHAIRLDETHVARLLTRFDLSRHFKRLYPFDDVLVERSGFDVWACAAREFVRSSFKHAASAVCGAAPERMFRAEELPVILTEDTAVETINGVPVQHFKDVYKRHGDPADGFYAAFVEVCRTELSVAHDRALTASPDDREKAWEDYYARKLFFDLEQKRTASTEARCSAAAVLAALTEHKEAIDGAGAHVSPGGPSAVEPEQGGAVRPKTASVHGSVPPRFVR